MIGLTGREKFQVLLQQVRSGEYYRKKFQELLQQLRSGKYSHENVSVDGFGLNDEDLSELIAAIIKNPGQNARIKTLDLSQNYFKHPKICGLTGLTALKITEGRAEILFIDNCPKLLSLSAQCNRLIHVSFGNVTTLLGVDLNINHLTEICLDKQQGLLRINLSNNYIRELDLSSLTNIISLQIASQGIICLYLGSNPLTQLFYFDPIAMNLSSKLQVSARLLNKPLGADYSSSHNDHPDGEFTVELTSEAQLTALLTEYTRMFSKYKMNNCLLRSAKIMAYLHTGAQNSLPRKMASKIALLDFLDAIHTQYHRMFQQLILKGRLRVALESLAFELDEGMQIQNDLIDNFMRGALKAEINRIYDIAKYRLCPTSTISQTKHAFNLDRCLERLARANADSLQQRQRVAANMVLYRPSLDFTVEPGTQRVAANTVLYRPSLDFTVEPGTQRVAANTVLHRPSLDFTVEPGAQRVAANKMLHRPVRPLTWLEVFTPAKDRKKVELRRKTLKNNS